MDNHPIPQDVTGFKFKLIGSMTVKQFLYLLGFGILATVTFVTNLNVFIRFPLVALFAGIGAALAFLPIEGRPMDIMIANFAKTIPSENRFIFKKRGANLSSFIFLVHETNPTAKSEAKLAAAAVAANAPRNEAADKKAALISRLRNSSFRPDESEVKTLNNIHTLFQNDNTVLPVNNTPVAAPETNPEVEHKPEDLQEQKHEEVAEKTPAVVPPSEPENNIKLSGEQAAGQKTQQMPAAQQMPEKPNPSLSAGFPTLPDVGNVVLGIIRDPRGKSLANILVEVVDASNVPVRAFKTNTLGQFASATPLLSGQYRIHFEDAAKQHEFKDVEISLNGDIFQPLEITSIDAREKLRQELFGQMPVATA